MLAPIIYYETIKITHGTWGFRVRGYDDVIKYLKATFGTRFVSELSQGNPQSVQSFRIVSLQRQDLTVIFEYDYETLFLPDAKQPSQENGF
jgi:hypothetical protein